MKILGSLVFALAIANAFLAGMIYATSQAEPSKARCEKVVGVGNCVKFLGHIPRPRPVTLAIPEPLPDGQSL